VQPQANQGLVEGGVGASPVAVAQAVADRLHEVVQERHKPLEDRDPRQQKRQIRREWVQLDLREKSEEEDSNLAVDAVAVDIVPCPTHPSEGPVDGPTDPLERNRAMLPARFAMFLHFVRNFHVLHNRFHVREWMLFDE
jgi:hypothetical protein